MAQQNQLLEALGVTRQGVTDLAIFFKVLSLVELKENI